MRVFIRGDKSESFLASNSREFTAKSAMKLAENRQDFSRRILAVAGHHTTDFRAVLVAVNASARRADRGSKDCAASDIDGACARRAVLALA